MQTRDIVVSSFIIYKRLKSNAIDDIDDRIGSDREDNSNERIYDGMFGIFYFIIISIRYKELDSSPRECQHREDTDILD